MLLIGAAKDTALRNVGRSIRDVVQQLDAAVTPGGGL